MKATDVSEELRSRSRWSRWLAPTSVLGAKYGLFVIWGLMIVVFGALRPNPFLTAGNFSSIFDSQSLLLFLALGLVISLISGDFNLALPGIFSTCLLLIGLLNGREHLPWEIAVLCAFGLSILLGLVHVFFIVKLQLSSFIVTLGTGTALLGIAYAISDTAILNLSTQYQNLATKSFLGLQLIFFYVMAAVIVLWWVYKYTPIGRQMYFVGASQEVARLAGLNVNRLRGLSIIASCGMGGIAAIAGAAYLGTADPTLASNYLLPMFASTLLGATTVTPGRPNPWGTAAAAFFLVTGYAGLEILGLSGWIEQVFYGGALVIATAVSSLISRRIGGGNSMQISS